MKLFFDEDNGKGIPLAVRMLKAPELTSLEYPTNDTKYRYRWPKRTPDTEWLPWAGRENFLVISQNTQILEVPHEFELIEPNRVKIVFIENGHSKSWRVFRVLQSKWTWLNEQWHKDGPFVWTLGLNGHVEPYNLSDGLRLPSRERRLAAKAAAAPAPGTQGQLFP